MLHNDCKMDGLYIFGVKKNCFKRVMTKIMKIITKLIGIYKVENYDTAS